MSFQKYKEQVSIVTVAEALGYVRNLNKGKRPDQGHVYERYFVEAGVKTLDQVVINNLMLPLEKQKYFNEHGSKGFEDRGDVVDFVAKRIRYFSVSVDPYKPFIAVNEVLASFAGQNYELTRPVNVPAPVAQPPASDFNAFDWIESTPSIQELTYFTLERGISAQAMQAFIPFIKRVSNKQWKAGNFNFGFPYTILPGTETAGYELKNYNLKIAATGTNKKEGSWHASFASFPGQVSDVFLFESAIDAMSFYDIFKTSENFENTAFFSLGGNLSRGQLENIINYYPDAKIHTAFDNDFNGNLFDIQVACIKLKKECAFSKVDSNMICEISGTRYVIAYTDFNLKGFRAATGFRPNIRSHRPKNAKDFNEMLNKNRKNIRTV